VRKDQFPKIISRKSFTKDRFKRPRRILFCDARNRPSLPEARHQTGREPADSLAKIRCLERLHGS